MGMNAVVYARYSSHRQGEQSIEGQLAEARKYAEAHGLTILHEYCDTEHRRERMTTESSFSACLRMPQSIASMR